MPTLVSPGSAVWIIDESFYIPQLADTVPLFFIATGYAKTTYPTNSTLAVGTVESNVVRTVTSVKQLIDLYGVPTFKYDARGRAMHGDARNEYGLFALYQFLAGSGSRAYVVRADIDLAENDKVVKTATSAFTGTGNGALTGLTVNNKRPSQYERFIVEAADLSGNLAYNVYMLEDTTDRWILLTASPVLATTPYDNGHIKFSGILSDSTKPLVRGAGTTPGDYWLIDPNTLTEPQFYGTGVGSINALEINYQAAFEETWTITFVTPTTFTSTGSLSGPSFTGEVGMPFDNGKIKFTITAGSTPFAPGDTFTITVSNALVSGSLGASDVERRAAIVTALQATINGQQDVRSEVYEYNLILCPGYHETVDEMLQLNRNIRDEAFVVADTPVNKDADQVVLWGKTSARQRSTSVAYYYPWGLASNLDGKDVVCAPSGIALSTYAYSDSVSEVWFAPAGLRRGMTVGISQVGYVSGILGTATTFNELILNQGQRDALYEVGSDLNPIVFFPGRGIVVWGQKTSSPTSSALDRVNVVRMLCKIKRSLRKSSMAFVFEPNDQITRDNLKAMVEGYLGDILIKRGLYDFAVLCDSSNNTPARIDRNELWCDVGIKPTKSAEFIYIPITVFSTGAKMPK